MTITENKTSRIEEKLGRITELLRILLRANFRGWTYKFFNQEGRPIFLVKRKRDEDAPGFDIDPDRILRKAERYDGSKTAAIRLTALEIALQRGLWCNLKAVQIDELATYIEKVLFLLAD